MHAMVLAQPGLLLEWREVADPTPGRGEARLRVHACAVCRTDLHIVDGELHDPKLPLIPGHQIVGTVDAVGDGVTGIAVGDRVGVPWLGWSCGACRFCLGGRESSVANLTRADGEAFLALAPRVPVRTEVTHYPLSAANDALADLRAGSLQGAAVLVVTVPSASS